MIVLDTNVLAELMKPSPAPEVKDWVARQPAAGRFVTAVTMAEILYGLEPLPNGARRTKLAVAASAMFAEVGMALIAFRRGR